MIWVYNDEEFTDELIPEGAVGFVYRITWKESCTNR